MITAVDTSVLLAVFKGEKFAEKWLDVLVRQAALGELVICDIVAAEICGFFHSHKDAERALGKLEIRLDQMNFDSCYLAGITFKKYRKLGGLREHLIPDFLIVAHAAVQADCLAAIDRGYARKFFPRVSVLSVK